MKGVVNDYRRDNTDDPTTLKLHHFALSAPHAVIADRVLDRGRVTLVEVEIHATGNQKLPAGISK